jgi:hypothetical protein
MPNSNDLIVIGAGPAAVAALHGVPAGLRISVVTGAGVHDGSPVHPKIRSVAYEQREAPGVTDFRPLLGDRGLHDTATVGGLANYWGQQFIRYEHSDPWPRDIFESFADYQSACEQIEGIFTVAPPADSPAASAAIGGGFTTRTPPLLVGTRAQPQSGLSAMRHAFEQVAAQRGAQIIGARARQIGIERDGVRVTLASGEVLTCARVIIAAGVVGTLNLIARSLADIETMRFGDHSPYMLYTHGIDRITPIRRSDGLAHFNAQTIEKVKHERTGLFASVYRISQSPFSLPMATAKMPMMLRGWRPPPLIDIVKPMQVWTVLSKMQYRLMRNRAAVETERPAASSDPALCDFLSWLRQHGVRYWMAKSDMGFHYHAAEVLGSGSEFVGLREFLMSRFDARVVCVDASVLTAIGCRPHTLTAMATALRLASGG